MCGIVAIYNYHPSVSGIDREEMRRVRDNMDQRGPDGKGEWFSDDGRVGLGHRRLSIIDLSDNAAQPMQSQDGNWVITFNGEIYNYKALRRQLENKGHSFRSFSDTEVLLHLYAEMGEAMVHKLRGMFSFALWDQRKNGLFIARDHFGIKPLYYSDNGKTFRLASQVKALQAGGGIDTNPEPAGHVGFFLWGHVPETHTLYKEIRMLPPGSSFFVDRQGFRKLETFCSIESMIAESEREIVKICHNEMLERLRSALIDSVKHHLVADVPVGVFLSSGLDSTTLAALSTEIGGSLRTVTLGFEEYCGTNRDETSLAEEVASLYKTEHRTVWGRRENFHGAFPKLIDAMDQPTTDGVNTYFVSKAAAETGLKVAMSGIGGDEVFGGYPSFRHIPKMVKVFRLANRATGLGRAFRKISAPVLKHFTSPKYAGLLEYGGTCGGAYLLRRGMFMPWELPDILDPEMVREGWRELETLLRLDETVEPIKSDYLQVSALELKWYMRNQLLRDTDWASMAHSLEVRVPLLDIPLLYAVSSMCNNGGFPGKFDMAQAARPNLPSKLLYRPKTGFFVPIREWLIAGSELQQEERGLRGWAKMVYKSFSEEKT
jgi:asparagine synthase (glutamine-hydrolysing)